VWTFRISPAYAKAPRGVLGAAAPRDAVEGGAGRASRCMLVTRAKHDP
jgi:hypothetical protein